MWLLATCLYLRGNLRVRNLASHPTQVSTQGQLASTCDYLPAVWPGLKSNIVPNSTSSIWSTSSPSPNPLGLSRLLYLTPRETTARSQSTQQPNSRNAKYFGDKFNFPCACHFGCGFLLLWLLTVVSPHRKTPSFAAI